MVTWSFEERCLPLKFPWKIARGTATEKIIFKLTVSNGQQYGEGEIAFNVRYGENAEETRYLLKQLLPKWQITEEAQSYDSIVEFFDTHGPLPCSLRTGMETAWVHYLSAFVGKNVADFLKSKPLRRLATSFSLPILEPHEIEVFFKRWRPERFKQLKIKLDGNWQQHAIILDEVQRHFKGALRLDYNEAFKDVDTAIMAINSLQGRKIEFIEQPLPAGRLSEVAKIKLASPFPLFADEDLVDGSVTKEIAHAYHGVNVKLMKSGGYFNAIKQMRQAHQLGMQVLLGCMVETSLGIASAMMIAGEADYWDLDGMLLLAKEPEGLVMEEDGILVDSSVH
jgi:L-alanine-DL-glutamate epimerase-like enolase superfamily enzyme